MKTQIMGKDRVLFVAQCDNLEGEQIASAMEALYAAGAKNVQLLSTITKKGRPGYVFLIDGDESAANSIEQTILTEIGVTGWHRIAAWHRYVKVNVLSKNLKLITHRGNFSTEILYKKSSADPERVRPEFESCRKVRSALADLGIHVSFPLIRQKLIEAFSEEDELKTIVIQ